MRLIKPICGSLFSDVKMEAVAVFLNATRSPRPSSGLKYTRLLQERPGKRKKRWGVVRYSGINVLVSSSGPPSSTDQKSEGYIDPVPATNTGTGFNPKILLLSITAMPSRGTHSTSRMSVGKKLTKRRVFDIFSPIGAG